MTSALRVNSIFENDPFTPSTSYGRYLSNKPYAAEPGYQGKVFGNNIWQPASREEYHIDRSHLGQQISQRPKELSLVLPDIKTSAHLFGGLNDRISPVTADTNTVILEPLSAHSRSNNESAQLTPNSITSGSDHSIYAKQVSAAQRTTSGKSRTFQESTASWPAAREFQPSEGPYQSRGQNTAVHSLSSNIGLKASFPPNTTHGLQNIWSLGVQNVYGQQSNPGEFQTNFANGYSAAYGSGHEKKLYVRADKQNPKDSHDDLVKSLDRLELGPYEASFGNIQTSSRQLPREPSSTLPGRKHTEHYQSYAWSQPHYGQPRYWEAQPAGLLRTKFDDKHMFSVPLNGNATYQLEEPGHVAASKSTIPTNGTFNPLVRQQCQVENYGIGHLQAYSSENYANSFYPQIGNGTEDYRLDLPLIQSAVESPYMTQDRLGENNQLYRSPLLEDFRLNNKTKKFELKDIFDHIVEFSGDQLGSRFIQHKLEVASSDDKERVFEEIARDSRQLMTDVFGNYVIQKMFEHGNQGQKKILANQMKGHMYTLSTQTYGCRVVQKALEHILTDQQASLIKELEGCVMKVVENQNGNHVIQKAIERVPGEHIQFIVDAHRGQVHQLSKHAYGCRVIQRMLEHCRPQSKRQILDELHSTIGELIQDPFGNYVIQHVIVNGELQDRRPVIEKVQSKLMENAMHKFASNVVEKALDYAEEDQRRAMLQKLTSRDEQGQSQVIKLISHQYGNYVIQKSAAHLSGHALGTLIEEMEQYLAQLRRVSAGKQVTALETSIRDARLRLHNQQYNGSIYHAAPTHPRTSLARG